MTYTMTSSHTPEQPRNLILHFQIHQPRKLQPIRFFDIGSGKSYFDEESNKEHINRVVEECYLPSNTLLLNLIEKYPNLRITFSISGTTLEQLEEYAPEALQSFRALAATGAVEFLGETYYHSLACMIPGHEFEIQVLKHVEAIEKHLGVRPTVFRNTELIYNDEIGRRISMLGFNGIFVDGVRRAIGNQSPHHIYRHPQEQDFSIILRDYLLSDDIAFRFKQYGKSLTVEQYLSWIDYTPAAKNLVTIAVNYETFGIHKKKDSGIFTFLENLLTTIAANSSYQTMTAAEATYLLSPHGTLAVPHYVSWADQERDLSAWLGNDMQRDAFDTLVKLEQDIKNLHDTNLTKTWRHLQTSDHFYYMSTKKGSDIKIHNYFSSYPSPYEAFINYMNALTDLTLQVNTKKQLQKKKLVAKKRKISLSESALAVSRLEN
jgi:alpha-amylase